MQDNIYLVLTYKGYARHLDTDNKKVTLPVQGGNHLERKVE